VLKLRRYLFFFLGLLCLIIIFQNTGIVEVKLLFWSSELSKVILFFSLLLLGFAFGWLGHLLHLRKKDRT